MSDGIACSYSTLDLCSIVAHILTAFCLFDT